MKNCILMCILMLRITQAHAVSEPDSAKQKEGAQVLSTLFDISQDLHPDERRMQRWVGSSDPEGKQKDCTLLVYHIKNESVADPRPLPHYIAVEMKVSINPPAKAELSVSSYVDRAKIKDKEIRYESFFYEEKNSYSSGGSPEGRMAAALLMAPFEILFENLTAGVFKSKTTTAIQAKKDRNNVIEALTIDSNGVNDQPNERSAKCYGLEKKSDSFVTQDEARKIFWNFEHNKALDYEEDSLGNQTS
jgi:hypothetical protein